MRNFDLSPLYRSTVGFDRLGTMLDQLLSGDAPVPSYPPYNIEKTGEDAYRITIAVAGFGPDELDVEARDNVLVVKGKAGADAEGVKYLHRGIAGRAFERRFQLAEHVRVDAADLVNGLLTVDLVRELPEAMKPRRIEIKTGAIEHQKAA